jgi:DNA-binding response OmpR family regulator
MSTRLGETVAGLAGLRVLVVEDEAVIATEVEHGLKAAGCLVVGPAASMDGALSLLDRQQVDAALLDINLNGELVFPVADLLVARQVPFVFLTGYDERIIPGRFRSRSVCRKPCGPQRMLGALRAAVERHLVHGGVPMAQGGS